MISGNKNVSRKQVQKFKFQDVTETAALILAGSEAIPQPELVSACRTTDATQAANHVYGASCAALCTSD